MKKYGILAALGMSFALTGCGGEKQTEVAAQEAMADTMINSGSAGGSSGFSETYELDNTNGEALHFYVRNTRPESDVYTELKVSILCDEEEVAQEVLLPGESTVLTEMLKGLGVDEKTAAEDACRIEHVISEKSFAAMQAHLNQTKISDVESSGAQD